MKAIVQDRYGALDVLEPRDIEPPAIGPGEVLVRVHAAAVHPGDVFMVLGSPFPIRFSTGLRRPRQGVPGFDLAGTVEALGPGVTRFHVGDAVFGVGMGTCAELTRASASLLQPMPTRLSFAEAASIPTSALAALHGIRDAGRLRAGQRVLVNGASGGVGTFAVQIAKAMGAHVTGVCGTANLDLVRSIGADAVVDYTREDFTQRAERYDLILDNVENRALPDVRRALTPDGTLVLNSGTGATGLRLLVRLVRPILLSPFTRQSLRRYLSSPNEADLAHLRDLAESGAIRPVIDRTFPLAEAPDALRLVAGGHARGKVVIAVARGS